jgi:hypothetical protein
MFSAYSRQKSEEIDTKLLTLKHYTLKIGEVLSYPLSADYSD